MTQDIKDKINAMNDAELGDLIAFAQEVRKVKKAEAKEKEKELAEARASLAPSDFAKDEKVLVKYYSTWCPGKVEKVNGKSLKVTYTRKNRTTGAIETVELLAHTDKVMKVEAAAWEVESAKYAA